MTRLRRPLLGLAAALLIAGVIALAAVAPIFVARSNRVEAVTRSTGGAAAAALHRTLAVVDLHSDQLLWPRPTERSSARGHVDLPRLIEGRVAVQVFAAVTKVPQGINYERNDSTTDMIRMLAIASRWPPRTWGSRVERALYMAAKFDRAVTRSNGRLMPIRSAAELTRLLERRVADPNLVGGLLALEGAHATEGKLGALERLYQAGYRMVGLTHFFDNEVGGSSAGVVQGGLTDFGREAIAWMADRRMIVDLAHASPALIAEVLQANPRPVVVSHTGVRGTCPGPRNLSDEAIRGVADRGGLIGIGYWEAAVCGLSPDTVAAAIAYAVGVAGVDHVALGSDFDGATTTGFDTSQLVLLTDALRRHGFEPAAIRQIMGGNALRFRLEQRPAV